MKTSTINIAPENGPEDVRQIVVTPAGIMVSVIEVCRELEQAVDGGRIDKPLLTHTGMLVMPNAGI